jgi:hypothetical protein
MPGKRCRRWAVVLLVAPLAGCCSWCQRYCPAPAASSYCVPQCCCPAPACCAPASYSPPPSTAWSPPASPPPAGASWQRSPQDCCR